MAAVVSPSHTGHQSNLAVKESCCFSTDLKKNVEQISSS